MLTKEEILAVKEGDFVEESIKRSSGTTMKISRVEAVFFTDQDVNGRVFAEVQIFDVEDDELRTIKLRESNVLYKIISTTTRGRKPGKKASTEGYVS